VIGFNHIGTIGRFGNQMFQYAALKGIAANRGYEYTIPPENPKVQIDNYGLKHLIYLPIIISGGLKMRM
jgi:hypothetical protein